ncbi:unnamed protein product [Ranitomeya imitator]|uniref:Protein kinase domain-containing protein n=1 Tax=Ranitomeya imitator TaxID=111125 RepID=A0ABN9MRY6_9NEOB|nr:unnamed protein product [Ranitomeya imitator]
MVTHTKEEDYQYLKTLGSGTYGKVVMATEKKTVHNMLKLMVLFKSTTCSAKNKPSHGYEDRKIKRNNVALKLMKKTDKLSSHEGIISTHPIYVDSDDFYVLTQDLAPAGTPFTNRTRSYWVGIPEAMVKRCALQLTKALEYMHDQALVHRDIKPDIVLLMDKDCFHVKLSDFGLTRAIGTLVPSMSPLIPFMSPELCQLRRHEALVLSPTIDTWAFGILLFVSFTGCYPWERAREDDPLFQDFIHWQPYQSYISPPGRWTKFSASAQQLFHALFTEDPTTRSPVNVVLNYLHFPWGEDYVPEHSQEIVVDNDEMDN